MVSSSGGDAGARLMSDDGGHLPKAAVAAAVAAQQTQTPAEEGEGGGDFASPHGLEADASFTTARTESDADGEDGAQEGLEGSSPVADAAVVTPGEGEQEQEAPAAEQQAQQAEKAEKEQEEQEEQEEMDPVRVGEEVDTPWGVGKVLGIRPPWSASESAGAEGEAEAEAGKEAGKAPAAAASSPPHSEVYVVEALQWRMAGGQPPRLYLQRKELTKLSPYVIYKWPTRKKIQRAAYLKEAGNAAFKAQDMGRAEARYSEAIGVLQLATDPTLDNPEKASKIAVLVPTLNNLAAARLKSRRFEQAYVVARSAYELLTELGNHREGQVMKALLALGVSEEQLLSRYRRKAALFEGKALVELKEYAAALPVLEAAKQLEKEADASFKSTDARQVLQLLQAARQRKAAADKAEKARWSKTFAKFSEEGEAGTGAAPATPNAKPQPATAAFAGGSGAATASATAAAAAAAAAATAASSQEEGGSGGGGGVGLEGNHNRPKKRSRALARRNLRPWWMEYSDLLLLGAAGAGLLGAFAWLKATAPGRGGGRR